IEGRGKKSAPALLSADNVEVKPADTTTLPKFDAPKREVNSAVGAGRADAAVRDARFADEFPAQPWNREHTGQFLIVLLLASLLILLFLMIVRGPAILWKSVSSRLLSRGVAPQTANKETGADREAAEAAACRELMKQVSTDLTRALSAINGLKRAPA